MGTSAEAVVFSGAKQRCRNPKARGYKYYGGRGIEVRFASFKEFYAHVGPRPSAQHSLDRIDSDGHYEPGNVRRATTEEQVNNRRNAKLGKQKLSRLYCKRGHPLFGDNIYLEKTLSGIARHCLICKRTRSQKYPRSSGGRRALEPCPKCGSGMRAIASTWSRCKNENCGHRMRRNPKIKVTHQ
jgi:hypothetical protein